MFGRMGRSMAISLSREEDLGSREEKCSNRPRESAKKHAGKMGNTIPLERGRKSPQYAIEGEKRYVHRLSERSYPPKYRKRWDFWWSVVISSGFECDIHIKNKEKEIVGRKCPHVPYPRTSCFWQGISSGTWCCFLSRNMSPWQLWFPQWSVHPFLLDFSFQWSVMS